MGRTGAGARDRDVPSPRAGGLDAEESEPVGFVTYEIRGDELMIGLLHALSPRRGIGSLLVGAALGRACERGCVRASVVTTNDNVAAQRLYRALGFDLVEVRPGAVGEARTRKPTIPLRGQDGTPMVDELEFALVLRPPG